MTFRIHSIVWTLLVWGEIFAYTVLTMSDSRQLYQTVPIVALLFTIFAFLFFIFPNFKELLLFACWGMVMVIAILLRIWLIVDDTFLNMYITVTSILTSLIWCIVSHSSQVSDPAWHWYIWSSILIIAVCGAFNNQSKLAEQIYIVNTVILVIIQFIYAWYTLKHQTPGQRRCKHLWRISASTTLACTLLVGSILQKLTSISYIQWEMTVLSVELAAVFFIVIDGIIGFKHQGIKYEALDTNDSTP